MAIENTTNKIREDGGSSDEFDFDFRIFAAADLVVYKLDRSDDSGSALTLDTDYTVEFTEGEEGGTVTYTVPPTADEDSLIVRVVSITQPASIPEEEGFNQETLENALDRITMIAQQLDEAIERVPSIPITDSSGDPTEALANSVNAAAASAVAADASADAADAADASADASAGDAAASAAAALASEEAAALSAAAALASATPHSCLVTLSGNQSIATGTYTKITLDTEVFDVGSKFASNKFTATGTEKVEVKAFASVNDLKDGGVFYTCIYKNGVIFSNFCNHTGSANQITAGGSIEMSLVATDYIELYVRHDHGSNREVLGASSFVTFLSVRKVG
jgi:hypothetical protein